MQEKHLFEYAVIRIVPQVEREEFLNVGVVLFCAKKKFLQAKYKLDTIRIAAFAHKLDIPDTECYLRSFERICAGAKDSGPIGKLTPAERFRWLTATRSTVVQTSKVHPGFCEDPLDKLAQLYAQLVAQ